MRGILYHNPITGSCSEVNVVWVTGHSSISSLNVARHILTHRVYALTGTVGTWRRFTGKQWKLLLPRTLNTTFNTRKTIRMHNLTQKEHTKRLKVIIRHCGHTKCFVFSQKTKPLVHTHTVSSTGLQNAPCSTFSIFWEWAIIQQIRVGTESQDLETKRDVSIVGVSDMMKSPAWITT